MDLLGIIDPVRNTVTGSWHIRAGILELQRAEYGARIEIPWPLPPEYDLEVTVEPIDEPNGLVLGQVIAGRQFHAILNFVPGVPPDISRTMSAIEYIGDKSIYDSTNPTLHHGSVLEKRRKSKVICSVRTRSVKVTCDGTGILEWEGDPQQLGIFGTYWKTPHANAMYLGGYSCRFRFHRVELKAFGQPDLPHTTLDRPHTLASAMILNGACNQVFVSYSHEDADLKSELMTHLVPFFRKDLLTAWADDQIAPGSNWFDEISQAVKSAKVAVLLVSKDFLASDFIHDHELGPLLQRAVAGNVKILWILVRDCSWKVTVLKDYQAIVAPPGKALARLRTTRDEAWVKVCEAIKAACE